MLKYKIPQIVTLTLAPHQQTNELRGVEKKNGESFSTFSASVPRPELCKLYSNSFQFLLSI